MYVCMFVWWPQRVTNFNTQHFTKYDISGKCKDNVWSTKKCETWNVVYIFFFTFYKMFLFFRNVWWPPRVKTQQHFRKHNILESAKSIQETQRLTNTTKLHEIWNVVFSKMLIIIYCYMYVCMYVCCMVAPKGQNTAKYNDTQHFGKCKDTSRNTTTYNKQQQNFMKCEMLHFLKCWLLLYACMFVWWPQGSKQNKV